MSREKPRGSERAIGEERPDLNERAMDKPVNVYHAIETISMAQFRCFGFGAEEVAGLFSAAGFWLKEHPVALSACHLTQAPSGTVLELFYVG